MENKLCETCLLNDTGCPRKDDSSTEDCAYHQPKKQQETLEEIMFPILDGRLSGYYFPEEIKEITKVLARAIKEAGYVQIKGDGLPAFGD